MKLPYRTRYALALLAFTAVTVVSLSAALLFEFGVTSENLKETAARSMDRALLRQYERRAADLSITLSESLADPVYLLDVDTLSSVVNGLSELPDILGVSVYDQQGLLFSIGGMPGGPEAAPELRLEGPEEFKTLQSIVELHEDSITGNAPIVVNEQLIGHVVVNLSLAPIQREIAAVHEEQSLQIEAGLQLGLWASLGTIVAFGALGAGIAVALGARFSRPITVLSALARQIGQGNYNVPQDIEGSGETRELVDSFLSMARDLRRTTVSKTYLDNVLHGMLDSLLVVGPDNSIRTVNRATCRLLCRDERDLLGKPVYDFIQVGDGDLGPERGPQEGLLRIPDGPEIPVLVSSAQLPGDSDEAASSVWVCRDISAIKETQNALLTAVQEAVSANQAKSQFLANMSHELRTPLNAIIGYSELLLEEMQDQRMEAMGDDMQRIRAAGQHLLQLIDDILDLSKIEAGKMELSVEEFQLSTVVGDVVKTLRPQVDSRRNRLKVDCPDSLPALTSDPLKVRQILFNILSNAAKFTEAGEITISALASTEGDGRWIEISVADTGIGMDSTQLNRVFDEFRQADDSTTRQFGGTGLGLSISRQVARMLGGHISASSAPGKGSTFVVRLPVNLNRILGARKTATSAMPPAAPIRRIPDSGQLVLVIDDDLDMLQLAVRHLSRWGFRAVTASRGQEGIRLARELQPFAIILDIAMPDIDGWTVLRAVKEDPAVSRIPVIVSSVVKDPAQGAELGAAEVLGKPVDWSHLFRTLAGLMPDAGERHVMIVDDDELSRRVMSGALADAGWTITEAQNGQDALQKIGNNVPDLIVLDLVMPLMDGHAFLQALRANPGTDTIPVVIVSAKQLEPSELKALQEETEIVIEKGAVGWLEAVRVLAGAYGSGENPLAARSGE